MAALRLVVEEDQRFVLRDQHGVDPAVVVQVADGQPAAQVRTGTAGPGLGRDVGQPAVGAADQELRAAWRRGPRGASR